jgi:phenylpropionate dioxygenase-like ring-hydroxylating dioxygenase large terminal subunit
MSGNVLITQVPAFRNYWYPVADGTSIGPDPVARRLLGQDIVVWRTEAGVSAATDRCPHRAARLSCGWIDGDALVCPYHGWQYGTDGRASVIPQLGDDVPIPPRATLETFKCTEHWGWVWVCLGEPVLPLPDVPEVDDPHWRAVPEPESVWRCSALQLVDNNIDPAHVAFVHRNTFGTPARARVPVPDVTATDSGFKMVNDFVVQSRPGEVGETMRHTELELYGPFIILLKTSYPDGLVNFMLKGCTPEDDQVTRQIQQILRSDTEADRPAKEIVEFDEEVWREDQAVLEPAWPVFDPGPAGAMHLRTDRASIEYRRMVRDIVEGVPA